MRLLFFTWLFLTTGGLVALLIRKDSGYALLSWDVWTIEMSLPVLILGMLLLFTGLFLLIRFTAHLLELPVQLQDWRSKKHSKRAQQSMIRGLLQLAEGQWKDSEHSLTKDAEQSDTPLLNYLAAARVAQYQGAHERRDAYIRLAYQHMPSADVAVSLTQAQLQLADKQLEQALATLQHLRGIAPRHPYVLKLLARLFEQLGDWQQLLDLLPELHKQKVLNSEELARLEVCAHSSLLDEAASTDSLEDAWQALPKKLTQNQQLVLNYATHLHNRGEDKLAEPLLRKSLEKAWDEQMVLLYGQLDGEHSKQQLTSAESLLGQQPDNPILLLTLGRLSLKEKLWGKARAYLEASIAASGPAAAYQELGHLLETLDKPDEALVVYREGMGKTATNVPG